MGITKEKISGIKHIPNKKNGDYFLFLFMYNIVSLKLITIIIVSRSLNELLGFLMLSR